MRCSTTPCRQRGSSSSRTDRRRTTGPGLRPSYASNVLVHVETNVGFAAANNIGARALPGRAYLLVNNDAFVHAPGTVGQLLAALGHGRVGVVVPRLLNEDLSLQPTASPFTTPVTALVRASGLSRFVPDPWKPALTTHWDHGSSRPIDQAIGAVMLVEGRLWEEIGGLRETSFMYAEDLDLCWRARQKGRTTWFEAEAEFVHLGGTSSSARWSGRERARQVSHAERAMIRDHLPRGDATATLAFMRLGVAARLAYYRLARNEPAAAEYRGTLEGLGGSPDGQAARPSVPGRRHPLAGVAGGSRSPGGRRTRWIAAQAGRVDLSGRIRL